MKRILLPVGGAVLATGLLAAGLAGSASAAPDQGTVESYLAQRAADAAATIDFWTKSNNEALRQATAYHYDYKTVQKIVQKGGYVADGKPGSVPAIGAEKKAAAKVQNVNLPKTIGKVFFQTRDGKLYWCSGTSIQSNYKNLVSTAGHCVYEDSKNEEVVSRWVFVPMYYQGKTPAGIYVGKQAFTHYDYTNYEDYDRDYAFVTVYDGIKGGENGQTSKATQVSPSEYKAHTAKGGNGYVDEKAITKAEYDAGVEKHGPEGPFKSKADSKVETIAKPSNVTRNNIRDYLKGKGGVQLTDVEVTKSVWTAAPRGYENGYKRRFSSLPVAISKEEFDSLKAAKIDGKFLGDLGEIKDSKGNVTGWAKQQYFVNKWVKTSTGDVKYWVENYYVVESSMVNVGRLGDNVGGQGFAWNQPTGKYVRTFGYPFAQHPDGSKNYTGVTPKWCYGKTTNKGSIVAPARKVEEQIGLKCAVTGGYDGGPWLLKYSNAKRLGYVNGVTSLFVDSDGNDRIDSITSPYFDGETAAVYNAAKNVASGKILP